jgi:hypothetical protein
MEDTVFVFTGRSVEQMLIEGGSQSWSLDAGRARRCSYLVCSQNRHSGTIRTGVAPHGSAFLVAKILDVVDSAETAGRYNILFTEFARISIPSLWGGWRNPVKYTSLEELGLDASALEFERTPDGLLAATSARVQSAGASFFMPAAEPVPLSLDAAKRGLAASFGVSVDAIEITIRG